MDTDKNHSATASEAFKASKASLQKVLIITYYWPPSGGAGVQRWLKFSKYLPGLGWEPVILTVDPQYASYPAIDITLEKEIPAGLTVFRTKATDWFRIYGKSKVPSAGFAKNGSSSLKGKISRFIRGNFFIPDPRRGWNKFAFRKACEIIERENIKFIITTSPPHSTQLIGLRLKKRYKNVKWIVDLRDPWTGIYYYEKFYPSLPARMLDTHYERSVLKKADAVITVGNSLKSAFAEITRNIEDKISVITNGYDESDFSGLKHINPSRLTITYVGTISDSYPVDGLLEALLKLKQDNIDFLLKITGEIPGTLRSRIESELPGSCLEITSYMEHSLALSSIINSSVVVLIIPDHKSNKGILTGKLFEYLASGVPVLCLGPADGDAAEIIKKARCGASFSYDDSEGIAGFLRKMPSNDFYPDKEFIKEFTRKRLAEKINPLLTP
jgi:glycosyltransferase involved in cell wall biosynthesis